MVSNCHQATWDQGIVNAAGCVRQQENAGTQLGGELHGADDDFPRMAFIEVQAAFKLQDALAHHRLKLRELLEELNCVALPDLDPDLFFNVNTPLDWANIGIRQKA